MPTTLNELWNVAASGIYSRQRQMDIISHNVANTNTPGFRASQAGFQALVQDRTLVEEDAAIYEAAQPGAVIQDWRGTTLSSTTPSFAQGALQETGDSYNLAIAGNGFFQLTRPDGSLAYTRSGDFHRDSAGQLVNGSGERLAPALTIPADVVDVYVDPQGQVLGRAADSEELTAIGQVQLASFPNPDGLTRVGETSFAATPASGAAVVGPPGADGRGTLLNGYLEGSNVDLDRQMVELLQVHRNYSLNLRALRAADEMYRLANELQR